MKLAVVCCAFCAIVGPAFAQTIAIGPFRLESITLTSGDPGKFYARAKIVSGKQIAYFPPPTITADLGMIESLHEITPDLIRSGANRYLDEQIRMAKRDSDDKVDELEKQRSYLNDTAR